MVYQFPLTQLVPPFLDQDFDETVINICNGVWNFDKLVRVVPFDVAQTIQSINLPLQPSNDHFVWGV